MQQHNALAGKSDSEVMSYLCQMMHDGKYSDALQLWAAEQRRRDCESMNGASIASLPPLIIPINKSKTKGTLFDALPQREQKRLLKKRKQITTHAGVAISGETLSHRLSTLLRR